VHHGGQNPQKCLTLYFFRQQDMLIGSSFASYIRASVIPDQAEFRSSSMHCKENPIYVLLEKKLRSLRTKFHNQVSVSDLYIPAIGPPIFLQQNRQTDCGNI
jgi:hypothetical protein